MFSFFERRIDPFPEAPENKPPETLLGFSLHYLRPALPWLVITVLLTVIISVGSVLLFVFMGQIVDWLAASDPEAFWSEHRSSLIWMGIVTLVVLPLSILLASNVQHQVMMGNLPMSIRWRMHRYLLGQSMGFFANEFAGRITTKIMQTALAVRQAALTILDVLVYVSVYFLTTLGLLGASDWRLALPLVVWIVIYLGMISFFVPRLAKVSERQADARSVMTGRVVDSYTNIGTVKLFAHAGREQVYARESMNGLLKTVYPMMRLATGFEVSIVTLNLFLIAGTAGLGMWLWTQGAVSAGVFAVAVGLSLRIHNMSQWIMWEVSNLFENIGVIYDGLKLMKRPIEVSDKPDAKLLQFKSGEIEFDNVKFHYGKESGVMDNLSLTIKPGERVGLVGRSGAGKSTLANLLLRFYDVEAGSVRIDGQDISNVQQDSLRSHIAMVSQDTSLLHRSIRDNIAYGRPDATEEEVIAATRQANALNFIETLEDQEGRKGFDAHVGERGVKLSGGQRQRIAIARVFLKNAPILILDEATSALDSEVEAAIQDHLFTLMESKTVIAIAHRLSTIAAMDRLVVLDKGEIIEQGTHDELLAKGGLYADLWAMQTGGVIGEVARMEEKF